MIKSLILGYIEESTQPICYVDYPSGKLNAQNISKTLCEYICLNLFIFFPFEACKMCTKYIFIELVFSLLFIRELMCTPIISVI